MRTSIGYWAWLAMLIWMAVVYHGALQTGYFLDDEQSILLNPSVIDLGIAFQNAMLSDRGLVTLSFAGNYALHGAEPWGYHLVNLVVHYLNGLLLFGLLSRTLQLPSVGMDAKRATWLGFAGAMIWLIHPLGSQAVIYLAQRAELMASGMYLLGAYSLVRSVDSPTHWRRWQIGCVLACLLGMQCKLICVTMPVTLLAMDRLLLLDSFGRIFKTRRWMYLGLIATWGMMGMTGMLGIFSSDPQNGTASAGAGLMQIISPSTYLAAQSSVILYYLKLSVWPVVLVFDHNWPVPATVSECGLTLSVMVVLFLVTVILAGMRVRWSILPLAVFLILAPTCSFVPVFDLAVEHRMYLAVACVIVGILLLLGRLLRRFPSVFMTVCVLIILMLSIRTWFRVGDYQQPVVLWQKVLAVYPDSPRARLHLQVAQAMAQGLDKHIQQLQRAIADDSNDASALHALGEIYLKSQRFNLARPLLEKAVNLKSDNADYCISLAQLQRIDGRLTEASKLYEQVIQQRPEDVSTLVAYAELLAGQKRWQQALDCLNQALVLKPDDVTLKINQVNILLRADRKVHALIAAKELYAQSGQDPRTFGVLASAYAANGQWAQARDLFEQILAQHPRNSSNLGTVQRLAWLYATCPDESVCDGVKALTYAKTFFDRVGGSNPVAWDTLAAALARSGDYEQAIHAMHKAIARLKAVGRSDLIPAYQQRLDTYQRYRPWHQ
tara:strand:+ start:34380 stop:36542 length:2163 start_codon:yes stop_codon:yes gene_type:complete